MAETAVTGAAREQLAPGDVLARVRELAPSLAKRADEIEQERRVPPDVLDALAQAGCFRTAVPASYGGADAALPEILEIVEVVAQADATVGWTVAQAMLAAVVFGYFAKPARDEVYAGGPDVRGAGAAAPKGRATWTGEGWRISGRWPLVTGCKHASWLYLQCLVVDDEGELRVGPGGIPEMRMMLVPASQIRVIETWKGLGLRGSGSHDVHVSGALCSPERSCTFSDTPVAGASFRIPPPTQAGLVAAAVVVGIAAGAVDAIVELAGRGKRPAFSTRRLAESPLFQDALGDASTTLAAARSLLHAEVARADRQLAAGEPLALLDRARLLAVGPKVAELTARVVDTAYGLGGGSAVYDGSPLQRRLRDVHSLTQHFSLNRELYGRLGALLAGEEVDPAIL